MLVQPLGELQQPRRLALVHLRIAFRVVAHEHLREVGVERLDVLAERVAVVEVELLLARLLDRHRELVAARLRLARDVGAVLLVDEDPRRVLRRPVGDGALEPLPDQALRAGDLVRAAADHLLERPSVVERQDVELRVVAELVESDLAHSVLPSGELLQLAELVSRLDPANRAGP